MIDSDDIIQRKAMCDTPHPPCIPGFLMILPVIERISPKLSVCRKAVRRAACHCNRQIVLIQLELLCITPCICTVKCHIDRNISDDLYTLLIRILLQGIPLSEKLILHKFIKTNIGFIFLSGFFQCFQSSVPDAFFPLAPAFAVVGILQSHKKCIIRQPAFILFHKAVIVIRFRNTICHSPLVCHMQDTVSGMKHFFIIYGVSCSEICSFTFQSSQKAILDQCLQINKIWISGKSGERLVRRIPVTGRSEWQNLPQGLPAFF